MHGAGAPQVRKKADERIKELVHPAIDTISELLEAETESVALAAARDVLDRAGYKPGDTLRVEGSGGPLAVEAVTYDYTLLSEDEQATLEALLVKCRRPAAPDASPGSGAGDTCCGGVSA